MVNRGFYYFGNVDLFMFKICVLKFLEGIVYFNYLGYIVVCFFLKIIM